MCIQTMRENHERALCSALCRAKWCEIHHKMREITRFDIDFLFEYYTRHFNISFKNRTFESIKRLALSIEHESSQYAQFAHIFVVDFIFHAMLCHTMNLSGSQKYGYSWSVQQEQMRNIIIFNAKPFMFDILLLLHRTTEHVLFSLVSAAPQTLPAHIKIL